MGVAECNEVPSAVADLIRREAEKWQRKESWEYPGRIIQRVAAGSRKRECRICALPLPEWNSRILL